MTISRWTVKRFWIRDIAIRDITDALSILSLSNFKNYPESEISITRDKNQVRSLSKRNRSVSSSVLVGNTYTQRHPVPPRFITGQWASLHGSQASPFRRGGRGQTVSSGDEREEPPVDATRRLISPSKKKRRRRKRKKNYIETVHHPTLDLN